MQSRFKLVHVLLVVAIVVVFSVGYVDRLDMPPSLLFGLSAFLVAGATTTFFAEYRRTSDEQLTDSETSTARDPRVVRFLIGDVRSAPLWLVLRLYLGLQWLDAGWHKVTSDGWTDGGTALQGYWERAVQVPAPPAQAPITYDWYRAGIQFMLDHEWYVWFAKLIAVGEVLVGIGLIVGIFVGLAAAGGLMMNTAFMLAGSASTNPVLGAISILIILGWKVAGHWGLDRYLLPIFGTPWGRRQVTDPSERRSSAATSS